MDKKFDVVALGEVLIDFTYAGTNAEGKKFFEQNPGGAPANLLTTVSHMGGTVAMIGKVGADMHGRFLLDTMKQENICIDAVVKDEAYFTTLAFVGIDANGEREFSFARKPGADIMLHAKELDLDMLKNTKIFHVGSLSLTDEPAREATMFAVKLAKEAGALISYDPNYRESLWKSKEAAVREIKTIIPYTDIMKVSDEEGLLLTGEDDYRKAAKSLLKQGPSIVAVTLGAEGVYVAKKETGVFVPAFTVAAVDTTGAGDSFWGGFLSQLLKIEKEITHITEEELLRLGRFGNAVASLCVQKRGGIPAIPYEKDVLQVILG